MKVYNFNEAEKIIRENGFSLKSQKGSHMKYHRGPKEQIILVYGKLNRMVWQRLVKEYNLACTF